MKLRLVTAAVLIAVCGPALAQTTATGTGTANSASRSLAIAGGGSGGQATAAGGSSTASVGNTAASSQIVFNNPGSTSSRIHQSGSLRTVPNAIAPGLAAAGIESCTGSISGGASALGWGVSFGGSVAMDNSCNRRLNARTMWSFGAKREALIIMSREPEVLSAMQQTGMVTGSPNDGGYAAAPVGYRRPAGTVYRPVSLTCTRHFGGKPTLPCVN